MRIVLLSAVLFGLVISAAAQDFPKAEIFGGYSYGNFQVLSSRSSLNGWNASATVNIYRWFGLTTDFGGLYGGKGSQVITLLPPTGTATESALPHFPFWATVFLPQRKIIRVWASSIWRVQSE